MKNPIAISRSWWSPCGAAAVALYGQKILWGHRVEDSECQTMSLQREALVFRDAGPPGQLKVCAGKHWGWHIVNRTWVHRARLPARPHMDIARLPQVCSWGGWARLLVCLWPCIARGRVQERRPYSYQPNVGCNYLHYQSTTRDNALPVVYGSKTRVNTSHAY